MNRGEVPRDLVEQVLNGNCIIFLGTHRSESGGIPIDSLDLAENLVERYGYPEDDRSLDKVAAYIEITQSRYILVDEVCQWVEAHARPNDPLDAHIASLPIDHVITTRFDRGLQEIYHRLGQRVHTFVQDVDIAFTDARRPTIIHIYGNLDQKESLVLTDSDHYSLFHKKPRLSEYLRSALAKTTVLFINYDLDTFQFNIIRQEIIREIGVLSRLFYAIFTDCTDYRRRYWLDKHIKMLNAEPLNFLQALNYSVTQER